MSSWMRQGVRVMVWVSSASSWCCHPFEARVHSVAQAVAQQVQTKNGDADDEPSQRGDPGRAREVGAAGGNDVAPGSGAGIAEAQEAERRLDGDRSRNPDGGEHDEGRDR